MKNFTIEELSDFLRIPVATIRKHQNDIDHYKLGRRLIFPEGGVIAWMNSRRRKPASGGMEKHLSILERFTSDSADYDLLLSSDDGAFELYFDKADQYFIISKTGTTVYQTENRAEAYKVFFQVTKPRQ
jgi:hypothetical protein